MCVQYLITSMSVNLVGMHEEQLSAFGAVAIYNYHPCGYLLVTMTPSPVDYWFTQTFREAISGRICQETKFVFAVTA